MLGDEQGLSRRAARRSLAAAAVSCSSAGARAPATPASFRPWSRPSSVPTARRSSAAHFAPLGTATPAPVLVFLEDTSLITEKVQQSKLAALGQAERQHRARDPQSGRRHEPRRPAARGVAASGAAGAAPDGDHPQQRRARERHHRQRAQALAPRGKRTWRACRCRPGARSSARSSCETMQWPRERLRVSGPARVRSRSASIPSQLRQIVWNLCENAMRYAYPDRQATRRRAAPSRCAAAAWQPAAGPSSRWPIAGPACRASTSDRIFEPFFTGRPGNGTGSLSGPGAGPDQWRHAAL